VHITDLIDQQAVDQAFGSGTFDIHLAHCGKVLHADVGSRIDVFFQGRGVAEGEHVIPAPFDHL